MAKLIPGKEEFYETLRYFTKRIENTGVQLHLGQKVDAQQLKADGFEEVILATGVDPRQINLEGIDHPKVLSYIDVLRHKKEVGQKVAIIGAGGIGFDVAEYLTHNGPSSSLDVQAFMEEWGVDMDYEKGGALKKAQPNAPARKIYMLQRSKGKLGARLGKTTGLDTPKKPAHQRCQDDWRSTIPKN